MPDIIWLGHAAFRLRGKDATIIADPFEKGIGLEPPRTKADIVTISRDIPQHNAAANIKGEPRVLRGPGEYEVRGVFITGVGTYADNRKGQLRGKNTAYVYELDGIVIAHLGSLGHTLTAAQVEALSNVGVLLVPVGSADALDPAKAIEVIAQIEPPIVIPMMYRTGPESLDLETLERFAREMGLKEWTAQEKLTIKSPGELPETTQVVVLEPKS